MSGWAAAQRPPLWPFAALSAGYFAHIGFFNPYLPLWLQQLGYGLWAIGLLTALQSATRVVAPYLWAWLGDRHGGPQRWLRWCAVAGLALTLGLIWRPAAAWWLPLVLWLLFMHTSGMMPLSEAALAHAVSHHGGFDAGRYGRIRLWGSLGFLVTVVLAGAWFERHGMGSFPAWAAATLLLVLLAVLRLPDVGRLPGLGQGAEVVGVWQSLRRPIVAWFFAALFWHVLAHVLLYVFFSLYLDAQGYGKGVIGALWATAVVVEIAWFFTQGRWLPRFSEGQWLLLAAVLTALRMGATAWGAALLAVLVVAQAVHAITFAAHHTVCIGFINRHFAGPFSARGQALYSVIGYGLAGVCAGAAGGWITTRWGLSAVFVAAMLAAILAVGCAWQVRRHEVHAASPAT